jgi:hypothetical protein
MTNKEKLSLLYGLYYNYCWRQFDELYNPMVETSHGGWRFCAGETEFSQDPLMIKCNDLIKVSKASQQNTFLRDGTMNWKEFEIDFMPLRKQLNIFLIR